MLLKRLFFFLTPLFILTSAICQGGNQTNGVIPNSTSTTEGVVTKLIVVPPYPSSFRELMEKQGNSILIQNLSNNSKHLYFNLTFSSLSGDVKILSQKPLLLFDLAPNSTKLIALNSIAGLLNSSTVNCSGITTSSALSYSPLPEGYYTLCVTPLNVNNNQPVGREACSSTIPMFAIEPPTLRLNSPTDNDTVINAQIQSLVFQWNTPSRIDPILINTLKATIKLVEVPDGMSATQAFQSAPSRMIAYTIQGQNLFFYGTNCTPLVRGRRYAAVIQLTDPQNKSLFRNNGTSEVITFVYGRKSENAIENQTSRLQGSVKWAYNAEEEIQNLGNSPLVTNTALTEKNQQIFKPAKEGKVTYPLANALVEVFGSDIPNELGIDKCRAAIASAKTDEYGNYDMNLIMHQAMQKYKYVIVEISHPSGLFNKVVKVIDYSKVENDYSLNNTVLVGQTIEFTPRVILTDGTINNKVSINILMPEKQWEKYSLLSVAGLGKELHKTFYNNQYYSVISTLKSGDIFKQLFQTINPNEHYLVQINYPDKPSAYYPLDQVFTDVKDVYNQKPIISITKNLYYDNGNSASGKIWYNGKGRNNVKVELSFRPEDVIGNYDPTKKYIAISELSGNYNFIGLPTLKQGTTIKYTIEDKTINDFPLEGELKVNSQVKWTKDFTFTDAKVVIKGQIIDESGKGIANALIIAQVSNTSFYTDNQGYYSLSLSQSATKDQLQVIADEYEDAALNVADYYKDNKKHLLSYLHQNGLEINIGKTILKKHISDASVLLNVIKLLDNNNIRRGTMTISPTKVAGKAIKIDLSNLDTAGFKFNYGAQYDPNGYNISFVPLPEDKTVLAPASYKVMLASNSANKMVTLAINATKVIVGVVKSKTVTGSTISQQFITVADQPYYAISDKSGHFQITVPDNLPIRLQAARIGYLNFDSSYKDVNDTIVMIPSISQVFNTLLGYPANVTFIKKLDSISYVISGYMSVANNAVFKATSTANMYFNNVKVSVDKLTNAILKDTIVNLSTNSTTLNVFDFANVQVTGIQLKATVGDITKGLLSGKVVLNPTIAANATLDVPPATLKSINSYIDSLHTVFSYADVNKAIDTAYSLYFTSKGMVNETLANINASINFDTARLIIAGIKNLRGNLQIGNVRQFVASNLGQIPIKVGILGTDFKLNELTVNNVSQVILEAAIQKVRASFNDVHINGLNTPNASLWMGGVMKIAQKLSNDIPFDAMSLVKNPLGYSVSTLMSMANSKTIGKLFNVNGFNFLPQGLYANFYYSAQNDSYNLNVAGTLNMSSSTSNPAAKVVSKAVFSNNKGVDVQMNLQTSNWGVFIAATPNQTADLGIATVNIGSFMVSIGSSASMPSMDSILQGTKRTSSQISFDTTLIDASSSDWALGISGSITFPVINSANAKSKSADGGGAIVLLSNSIANGYQAQVDTFYLNITTSVITVNASGSMVFTKEKHGFDVNGNLVFNNIGDIAGFGGGLKLFNFEIGGIELGISLSTKLEWPFGPVTFHSFGGGFDFNFNSRKFSVFINGDLGPTGIPKILIDVNCHLNVESSAQCNYLPIITGDGSVIVGDVMNVSQANMVLDLCQRYLMVTIDSDYKLPEPLSDAKLNNTTLLFVAAPSAGIPNGCFFYQSSIHINVPIININGDAGFGIGYNVSTSNPIIPSSYMSQLSTFVGNGTLNGFYVYAMAHQGTSGNFEFNAGVFDIYFGWNESVNVGLTFFANLDHGATVNLSTYFNTHIGANAGVSLLGFGVGLGGNLDVGFTSNTGYNQSAGFYTTGTGNATLQVYGGTSGASGIGCNSCRLTWGKFKVCFLRKCISVPYPNGVQAKACIGAGFDYGVQSGQSPYVHFHL